MDPDSGAEPVKEYTFPVSDLAESLAKYYESGQLCDAEIHAGGTVFHAHRLVLCAASPYFEAVYLGDFEESKSGTALKLKVSLSSYLSINSVRTNGPTLCPQVSLPYVP